MLEVRRSTIVDAPIEAVWPILRDFNGHDRWHPAVARSVIEENFPPDMVGAVRDFRLSEGARIREQLLSLSDREHCFDYCILEAPLPLIGYVARAQMKPATDGNRTFWEWRSRFEPPPSRRRELVKLVREDTYEAGFCAITDVLRGRVIRPRNAISAGLTEPARPNDETEAHAIIKDHHGGPDVLQYRTVKVPRPGRDEVRIRQHAIGVNFIDSYIRTGYFGLIRPPGIPGM